MKRILWAKVALNISTPSPHYSFELQLQTTWEQAYVCVSSHCFVSPLRDYRTFVLVESCVTGLSERPAHSTVPSQVATQPRLTAFAVGLAEIGFESGAASLKSVRYHWATSSFCRPVQVLSNQMENPKPQLSTWLKNGFEEALLQVTICIGRASLISQWL